MGVGIALIRGINVGGKNIVPMARLREVCEGLGWKRVRTLIQSGNVVFECNARAMPGAGTTLEAALEREFGFRPSVVVRTLEAWRAVMAANPFSREGKAEPSKLMVMFLAGEAVKGAKQAIEGLKAAPERVRLVGREVFIHYPNGVGASKLAFTKVEKAAGVAGTTRNWGTVGKLMEMGDEVARTG